MRVSDVMTAPAITVGLDTPIGEVAGILLRHEISGAPVLDGRGRLAGIVSEADLVAIEARPEGPGGEAWRRVRVPRTASDVMVREVVALPPGADVWHAARLMLQRRVMRIPVVEDDRVIGIVARRDLVRVLASRGAGVAERP